MKRVVINLSTKKYKAGQVRLIDTFMQHPQSAGISVYAKESLIGAPPHSECMYGFKPVFFQYARSMGYRVVLWLDASMYIRKSLDPLFDHIEKHGYFFQDSGWMNDRWTTPEQKAYFGTDAGKMISSGVIGLDLRHPEANTFLDCWVLAAKKGMFNGSHEVTRHDQTCASLIVEQLGLTITPNHTFWTYGQPHDNFDDNILIVANGIC
jgi:hypothetical protein